MEGIIIAIIGVCGTFIGNYFSNKKTIALIEYRLQQLEEKVDRHNHLVERMYGLEERVTVLEKTK